MGDIEPGNFGFRTPWNHPQALERFRCREWPEAANGTDGISMDTHAQPCSRSTLRLIAGGLMIAVAFTASWMIEPAPLIASTTRSAATGNPLLTLEASDHQVRIVSGAGGAEYQLLDQDGRLMGRFDSLDSVSPVSTSFHSGNSVLLD